MLRSVWKQQLQALSHNTASVDSSEDIQFRERCHYVINCLGALLNERVPDVSETKSGSQKHRRGNANLCHVDNVGLFFSHSSTLGTILFSPVKQIIFPTKSASVELWKFRWFAGRVRGTAVTRLRTRCWFKGGNYGASLQTTKDSIVLCNVL